MPNYQKLYARLFNAFTDAIEQIELCNFGEAREILIRAQQEAEEAYLNAEGDEE